ncbi:MAG: hypothetical protein HYZ45_12555 [Burkholderiales bacterium]|nr:hypothetical protein [Burkholderiales bacterium]
MINALKADVAIRAVDNCPGVPVLIGRKVYGKVQNDSNGIELEAVPSDKTFATMLGFGGANSESAVWHFATEPTHHFVVVPWYSQQAPQGQVYAVFMAFENQYTVHQYVQHAPGAMGGQLATGYRDLWTFADLKAMITALLTRDTAWAEYFQHGNNHLVRKITCYKYPVISVDKAIANVNR